MEMKAFFGLLIAAGVYQGNMSAVDFLWHKELGPPLFRATMGQCRFKALLAFIRYV
jgi:hypothetical protein